MANVFDFTGEVEEIHPLFTSQSGFTKREIVVTDHEAKYPPHITFTFLKANTALLNEVNVGDEVKITFSLNTNEWKNPKDGKVRHYLTLSAFKLQNYTHGEGTIPEKRESAPVPPPVTTEEIPF